LAQAGVALEITKGEFEMSIIEGYDSKSRQRVWTDDFAQQKEFGKEVAVTAAGKRFYGEFEVTQENIDAVLAAAATLFPGELVTVSRFVSALEVSMNAGDLTRKTPAPPVEQTPTPEPPRDKNGRPLSQSQIDWSSMTAWTNSHSAEECRQRARSDPKYAQFRHTNLVREMNSKPVDAAPSAGVQAERSATTADIQSELGTFANLYKNAPSERVRRPIAGRYVLDATHSYSIEEFETKLSQAARVGLL
jgi:hypothetical protein